MSARFVIWNLCSIMSSVLLMMSWMRLNFQFNIALPDVHISATTALFLVLPHPLDPARRDSIVQVAPNTANLTEHLRVVPVNQATTAP
jgi:hypothetical protein